MAKTQDKVRIQNCDKYTFLGIGGLTIKALSHCIGSKRLLGLRL